MTVATKGVISSLSGSGRGRLTAEFTVSQDHRLFRQRATSHPTALDASLPTLSFELYDFAEVNFYCFYYIKTGVIFKRCLYPGQAQNSRDALIKGRHKIQKLRGIQKGAKFKIDDKFKRGVIFKIGLKPHSSRLLL